MDKTCGTCGKCRNTHDGPYCYKGSSPRPVSLLRVNAPAGGLRLPERLEKTVPKVVIEKGPSIGDKVQPITPLEKFETAEIVEELRRRGFRCIIWMEA